MPDTLFQHYVIQAGNMVAPSNKDMQRWPAHLDALPPCFHCGGKEWRWDATSNTWLCRCYFEPSRRRRDRYIATKQPQQVALASQEIR